MTTMQTRNLAEEQPPAALRVARTRSIARMVGKVLADPLVASRWMVRAALVEIR
jgi:hypothetical protein